MQSVEHVCSNYRISPDSVLARFLCISRLSCLVNTDLINNCSEFEACGFSHREGTTRKTENIQFKENVK